MLQGTAFRIGFAISTLIFLVLQCVSYLRNYPGAGCFDCGWRFGFPFAFYQYGGFISYQEVLWLGFVGDLAFVLVIALWGGVFTHFIWKRRATQI